MGWFSEQINMRRHLDRQGVENSYARLAASVVGSGRAPRFTLDDAPAMFENWASDAEVTRFLTWQPHASVEVTRSVLADWVSSYEQPDFYQWAIELRELGEPIGSISVVELLEEVGSAEIGYCIGKSWWQP